MWELVKVEGDSIKRAKEFCPRCGSGVFMSVHKEEGGKERHYCGNCHYTFWP